MGNIPVVELPKVAGGLVQIGSNKEEDVLQLKIEEERRRLEQEAGVEEKPMKPFLRPVERPFTKDQRPYTTILFGRSYLEARKADSWGAGKFGV